MDSDQETRPLTWQIGCIRFTTNRIPAALTGGQFMME